MSSWSDEEEECGENNKDDREEEDDSDERFEAREESSSSQEHVNGHVALISKVKRVDRSEMALSLSNTESDCEEISEHDASHMSVSEFEISQMTESEIAKSESQPLNPSETISEKPKHPQENAEENQKEPEIEAKLELSEAKPEETFISELNSDRNDPFNKVSIIEGSEHEPVNLEAISETQMPNFEITIPNDEKPECKLVELKTKPESFPSNLQTSFGPVKQVLPECKLLRVKITAKTSVAPTAEFNGICHQEIDGVSEVVTEVPIDYIVQEEEIKANHESVTDNTLNVKDSTVLLEDCEVIESAAEISPKENIATKIVDNCGVIDSLVLSDGTKDNVIQKDYIAGCERSAQDSNVNIDVNYKNPDCTSVEAHFQKENDAFKEEKIAKNVDLNTLERIIQDPNKIIAGSFVIINNIDPKDDNKVNGEYKNTIDDQDHTEIDRNKECFNTSDPNSVQDFNQQRSDLREEERDHILNNQASGDLKPEDHEPSDRSEIGEDNHTHEPAAPEAEEPETQIVMENETSETDSESDFSVSDLSWYTEYKSR